jgi:hypothetical protein
MCNTIIAFAVALAFVLPGSAVIATVEKTRINENITDTNANILTMSNSERRTGIYSTNLCPLSHQDTGDTILTLSSLLDVSNLGGVLGDTFYAYHIYAPSLPEGPVSFRSDNPGHITFLKETVSSSFIAGGTWVEGTWYGCQYDNGLLWTIDEVTGTMTSIGGGGVGLNGLAYNPTTGMMYGASRTDLYIINMSTGGQTLVGPFNTGGLMIGIAFDGEGTLYGEDIGTDCLYSINPSTGATRLIGPFGIDLNYAQDMAYDITRKVLYLAAYTSAAHGQLYTCNVTTGACTLVGNFQGGAEIDGFAIPYSITPPDTPACPEGPTEGAIGVEYTFSTNTTDPDGDQVYYQWSWGDGTSSKWLGPFDSGDTVSASHTWMEIGTYEVKVKAKDIYNHRSNWSDPKAIHIADRPVLEIGNIAGGLFKVHAVINNNGSADAIRVNWSITLDGGLILLGKETSGRIAGIPAGGRAAISSGFILGFGKTVITISAETADSSDTVERDAFVFLFFIKIIDEYGGIPIKMK